MKNPNSYVSSDFFAPFRQAYPFFCICLSKEENDVPVIIWFVIGFVLLILCKSIQDFMKSKPESKETRLKDGSFSMELFYALIMLYSTIIIGFGLIYFALSFHGAILLENGVVEEVSTVGTLIHSMYFSGVTLLTIGYGDIVPIELGRIIALIESLIGYLLPTAFVFRLLSSHAEQKK